MLTHPLITRSIEQAQKRVELQNFQARKRLLEYDDVMNQQREVIYSLRSFALEGGEELKGEALKMIEKARRHARRDAARASTRRRTEWDFALLQQDLLMHYLLQVPELEDDDLRRPTLDGVATACRRGGAEGVRGEAGERSTRCATSRGRATAIALLSLVMLNVLDEKWKDHLYDLDQLRSAIHYRSWGQKDPLIEYKQEAYTMFVDLMNDIYNTFTERFLKAQLVFDAPPPQPPSRAPDGDGGRPQDRRSATTRWACSRTCPSRSRAEAHAGGEPSATDTAIGAAGTARSAAAGSDAWSARVARRSLSTSRAGRASLAQASAGGRRRQRRDRLVHRRAQRSVSRAGREEVQEVPRGITSG